MQLRHQSHGTLDLTFAFSFLMPTLYFPRGRLINIFMKKTKKSVEQEAQTQYGPGLDFK